MTTHLQVFSLDISMVCFGCGLKSINQSTNQLLCQILSVIQAGELNIFNVVIIMEHYKDNLLRKKLDLWDSYSLVIFVLLQACLCLTLKQTNKKSQCNLE